MGKTIDAYLILGWEVEVWDMENYDNGAGITDAAEERVAEILGKSWFSRAFCDPIIFPSLYYGCDYAYVGLVLMSSDTDGLAVGEYGTFLSAHSEMLARTAYDLYAAIMGKDADEEPKLMCVSCEG